MTNLNELAGRVEALTGPCREMDRDIADALGLGPPDDWQRKGHGKNTYYMDVGSWLSPSGLLIKHSEKYTESIDAAMTLLPEGCKINFICNNNDEGFACGLHPCRCGLTSDFIRKRERSVSAQIFGNGQTLQNALIAASLRAIAKETE